MGLCVGECVGFGVDIDLFNLENKFIKKISKNFKI